MAEISGTVTWDDGTAIEGATVIARLGDAQGPTVATTTTASDGSYTLTVDGGAEYHVKCQYEDSNSGDQHNTHSKPYVHVATTELVIDDFEDNDVEEYAVADGSTLDKTAIIWEDTTTWEGSWAIGHNSTDWLNIISHPDNTNLSSYLPNYPSQGDTIVWYYWANSGGNARIQYGVQDTTTRDNCYNCRAENRDDTFQIEERSGGSSTTVASDTSVTWPDNTWCKIEVTWADDGSGASELSATATDTSTGNTIASIGPAVASNTYTGGGFGWGFWGNSSKYKVVDYANIP